MLPVAQFRPGALRPGRVHRPACFTASRIAPRWARSSPVLQAAKSTTPTNKPLYQPSSARDAIETATRVFRQEKDAEEAIRLYNLGLEMNPNEDEARAALYNLGCALAKQKKWKEASESIVKAINEYGLKLAVALKDDDLVQLRERREWLDALAEAKGAITSSAKANLRTEAKAPFRLLRIILFGGLLAGAAVGLIVILGRLARSLQGGPDAPELTESLTNLAINTTAIAGLSYLLYRDVTAKQQAVRISNREELLGRLQVDLGGDRVLPLLKFRGQVRPVIVAGSRSFVDKALKEADSAYMNLRDRAVSIIPVVVDGKSAAPEVDPEEKLRLLKKEFSKDGVGFGEGVAKKAAKVDEGPVRKVKVMGGLVEADKKWVLTPYDTREWKEWILEQKEFANLPSDEPNCYIQIQLDGTVRSSGVGSPPWRKMVEDLPLLSDVRTRFMDGVGPSE